MSHTSQTEGRSRDAGRHNNDDFQSPRPDSMSPVGRDATTSPQIVITGETSPNLLIDISISPVNDAKEAKNLNTCSLSPSNLSQSSPENGPAIPVVRRVPHSPFSSSLTSSSSSSSSSVSSYSSKAMTSPTAFSIGNANHRSQTTADTRANHLHRSLETSRRLSKDHLESVIATSKFDKGMQGHHKQPQLPITTSTTISATEILKGTGVPVSPSSLLPGAVRSSPSRKFATNQAHFLKRSSRRKLSPLFESVSSRLFGMRSKLARVEGFDSTASSSCVSTTSNSSQPSTCTTPLSIDGAALSSQLDHNGNGDENEAEEVERIAANDAGDATGAAAAYDILDPRPPNFTYFVVNNAGGGGNEDADSSSSKPPLFSAQASFPRWRVGARVLARTHHCLQYSPGLIFERFPSHPHLFRVAFLSSRSSSSSGRHQMLSCSHSDPSSSSFPSAVSSFSSSSTASSSSSSTSMNGFRNQDTRLQLPEKRFGAAQNMSHCAGDALRPCDDEDCCWWCEDTDADDIDGDDYHDYFSDDHDDLDHDNYDNGNDDYLRRYSEDSDANDHDANNDKERVAREEETKNDFQDHADTRPTEATYSSLDGKSISSTNSNRGSHDATAKSAFTAAASQTATSSSSSTSAPVASILSTTASKESQNLIQSSSPHGDGSVSISCPIPYHNIIPCEGEKRKDLALLHPGQRVLARYHADGFFYPAVVQSRNSSGGMPGEAELASSAHRTSACPECDLSRGSWPLASQSHLLASYAKGRFIDGKNNINNHAKEAAIFYLVEFFHGQPNQWVCGHLVFVDGESNISRPTLLQVGQKVLARFRTCLEWSDNPSCDDARGVLEKADSETVGGRSNYGGNDSFSFGEASASAGVQVPKSAPHTPFGNASVGHLFHPSQQGTLFKFGKGSTEDRASDITLDRLSMLDFQIRTFPWLELAPAIILGASERRGLYTVAFARCKQRPTNESISECNASGQTTTHDAGESSGQVGEQPSKAGDHAGSAPPDSFPPRMSFFQDAQPQLESLKWVWDPTMRRIVSSEDICLSWLAFDVSS